MRAWLRVGMFLALAIRTPPLAAEAAPPAAQRERQRASFRYERARGTEQCPDASTMRRTVEGHLGYDPFDETAGVQVRCQIVAQRARLQAIVIVSERASGRSGERKLASTNMNCTELAEAAALAIAIAIDPLLPKANTSEGSPRDEAMPTPSPGDENAAAAPTSTAADRASREGEAVVPHSERSTVPFLFSIGAGGSLSYALQPTAAFGASLALAARRGPLSLALEMQWRSPSHLTYWNGTITAQLFSAGLMGCGHYRAMNACFLADAGVMAGSAEGYLRSARDTTPYMATGARLGWEPSLFGHWAALIYIAGIVPMLRTTLWVDPESVWTMPRLAAQAGILGFFSFP